MGEKYWYFFKLISSASSISRQNIGALKADPCDSVNEVNSRRIV